ncbi:hypothetical protein JFT66_02085 [Pseudomonas sp. MF6755]|uniref:hypothetical protein n=1 Tax=Pseudomonas sp. MF6755 TaxID=2797530 RepID=UPI0018E8B362|nr:hypothetical protein [Pseudomonas sp. MF6755]MBJ2282920.1 hypothetical protein [Pseudomonas sp. MF6755]
MSVKRSFLMTYSVTAYSESDRSLTDRGRRKIADMQTTGWGKIDDLETAFSGTLTLTEIFIEGQRNQAETQVREVIRDLMTQAEAYAECQVTVAVLVDGLGPHISLVI